MLSSHDNQICGGNSEVFIGPVRVHSPEIMTPPNPVSHSSAPDWPCSHLSGSRAGGSESTPEREIKVSLATLVGGGANSQQNSKNHPIFDNEAGMYHIGLNKLPEVDIAECTIGCPRRGTCIIPSKFPWVRYGPR